MSVRITSIRRALVLGALAVAATAAATMFSAPAYAAGIPPVLSSPGVFCESLPR